MLDARVRGLGLASSYGAGAREVECAFEHGVSFFFWGALRRRDFGAGLRRVASSHRDKIAIAVQTFTNRPWLVGPSVEIARRRLNVDAIDVLCLAYRNGALDVRIVDAARALVAKNVVRSIIVSSHDRALLVSLAEESTFDGLMVRYNAAHRGAADAVFPAARAHRRPVIAYTATRWGSLVSHRDVPLLSATDCYRFVLSHPAVTACLFAPRNAEETTLALDALDRRAMSPDELARATTIGDEVRARVQSAPPLGLRGYARHAIEMARSIREDGITEDLLSRFNR